MSLRRLISQKFGLTMNKVNPNTLRQVKCRWDWSRNRTASPTCRTWTLPPEGGIIPAITWAKGTTGRYREDFKKEYRDKWK